MSGSRLENYIVSDVADHEDDVDWKGIFSRLRQGNAVEIACVEERDYARRAKQVAKRAEKKGVAVEVLRGEGVLRVEPRPATGGNTVAQMSSGDEEL